MLIAGTVNLCILLLAAANLAGRARAPTPSRAPTRRCSDGTRPASSRRCSPSGCSRPASPRTSVGAYAGAEIMHGLLHVRVPLLARRLVTLIPALVILGIGFDPTLALVLSQVVLSFGIPFALIPLVVAHREDRGARRVPQPLVRRRPRGSRHPSS